MRRCAVPGSGHPWMLILFFFVAAHSLHNPVKHAIRCPYAVWPRGQRPGLAVLRVGASHKNQSFPRPCHGNIQQPCPLCLFIQQPLDFKRVVPHGFSADIQCLVHIRQAYPKLAVHFQAGFLRKVHFAAQPQTEHHWKFKSLALVDGHDANQIFIFPQGFRTAAVSGLLLLTDLL